MHLLILLTFALLLCFWLLWKRAHAKGSAKSLKIFTISPQFDHCYRTVEKVSRRKQKQKKKKQQRENIAQTSFQSDSSIPPKEENGEKRDGNDEKAQGNERMDRIEKSQAPSPVKTTSPEEIQDSLKVAQSCSELVVKEIELIRLYFQDELEELRVYDGRWGHYRLYLQGTLKYISIQWQYNDQYPRVLIEPVLSTSSLNPLEMEILARIKTEQHLRFEEDPNCMYILNMATAIFEDILMPLSSVPIVVEIKEQRNEPPKQEMPVDRKQVYNQVLDEIFYLEEAGDPMDSPSQSKEESKPKFYGSRGRYRHEFEEVNLIGQGTYGKVYCVKNKVDRNHYAIKKVVVNYANLNERKMLKEVTLLSKLNHPNIVRYYQSWLEDVASMDELIKEMCYKDEPDRIQELNENYQQWLRDQDIPPILKTKQICEEDQDQMFAQDEEISDISIEEFSQRSSKYSKDSSIMGSEKSFPYKIMYIVMELCSGISLRQFIDEHFNKEEPKIKMVRGILEGLSYIHSRRIIHRDLKPANIFLTPLNKPKIGDFGIATEDELNVFDGSSGNQAEKTTEVGTGHYRAPELFRSAKYSEKMDIYSLGMILFEMFYKFNFVQERAMALKLLASTHNLPKDFPRTDAMADIADNIESCLKEDPSKRPTAEHLLGSFRSKYFTELVSCITDPKHVQFSQIIKHLFAMRNQFYFNIMRRDLFRTYLIDEVFRIYHLHRGTIFVTLPFAPIRDMGTFNGIRMPQSRDKKFLLLSERGILLQYISDSHSCWVKYAKESLRRRKQKIEEEDISTDFKTQRQEIRRYTFEKVADFSLQQQKKDEYAFTQKLVTAFDIAYTYEKGFNADFFCEMLVISESMVQTLALTQKNLPIFLCHSRIWTLLAKVHNFPAFRLYESLLAVSPQLFSRQLAPARMAHFQTKQIPLGLARKICSLMDTPFDTIHDFLQAVGDGEVSEMQSQILTEALLMEEVKRKLVRSNTKWKLILPQAQTNGLYWSIGPIKGFTSREEYSQGQEFCNLHLEMDVNVGANEPDLSIKSVSENLEDQVLELVSKCWQNQVSVKWLVSGEKENFFAARHGIVLKKKQDRVFIAVRKDMKKGTEQSRDDKFKNKEQFDDEVLKSMSSLKHPRRPFYNEGVVRCLPVHDSPN